MPAVMYSQPWSPTPSIDGHRAGVANGEALARGACAVELSTRRAVQRRVADEARIAGVVGRRGDHDAAAAHRLADAVVRLADEVELDPGGEERAEALSGGALEARAHAARRRRRACDASDCTAEPGSDRTIAVRDLMARLDERRALERRAALCVEEDPEPVARVPGPRSGEARGPFGAPADERRQVEAVDRHVARATLREALHAPDGVVERAQAERREQAPHLLGDEEEVRLHHLGRPAELLPQLRPLGRDPDGAAVEVARAHHETALREQERRPERVLVGTEQRGDDDVAPGLEAAVGAEPHAATQVVRDERLLRLGEPELPRDARALDRDERAGSGATVRAGDVDDVCVRLRHARRDEPDAALRDELHGDRRVRVHLAQVEDELGEILDRVDVVVRRRRDEGDAGPRLAQAGDLLRHLVRGDLAALAGLRALRDLDLELLGRDRVLGAHAEPARRDLLDLRVALVAEAIRALAALARVRAPAEAVQRDRDGLVRLCGERAVRHRSAREATHDRRSRLDLVERDRRAGWDEVEQVARLERGAAVHELGEAVVQVGAVSARRCP